MSRDGRPRATIGRIEPLIAERPGLTTERILGWAEAHKERTGNWPTRKAGQIPEAPGETWAGIDLALRLGKRGLPGQDSIFRLLSRHKRLGLLGM